MKLIIADAGDDIYDSGVFLEENSLVQEVVSAIGNTVNNDSVALEGCTQASFTFNLDSALAEDMVITYGIGGTAVNGVDYNSLDTALIIRAGQTTATIIIDALAEKTGFLKSNGEARRALKENSISVNKEKVTEGYSVVTSDLINDQFVLLQRGKKNYFIIKVV